MTYGKEARVSLTPRSLKAAVPNFTLATVHIVNNTGHEIQYLFVSPSDSDAWGVDLLDENDDEYQFNMTIDPKAKQEFTWAIEPA